MLRKFLFGFALAGSLTLAGCESGTVADPIVEDQMVNFQSQAIEGQYIVVFEDSAIEQPAAGAKYADKQAFMRTLSENIALEHGVKSDAIKRVYGTAVRGFAANLNDKALAELAADSRVAYIEEDQEFTVMAPPCSVTGTCDPGGGGGGGDEVPWGITRVSGGAAYTGSGKAWVIDSGIDLDHPDLNVNTALSRDFTGSNVGADDQNGHGTHCAGTIAAKADGAGVVGVAAGATVVAVRVLDRRGSGSYSGVIGGIDYVAANGSNGDVANLSLGGGYSQAVNDAVIAAGQAGVKMAVAAGNSSADSNNYSPASANGNNVYTISAIDSADKFASFSNYGNPPVDYAAPGVSVKSTWKDGGYNTISGTSMATPHAAGVLLWGGNPGTDGNAINDPDGNPDPIISR